MKYILITLVIAVAVFVIVGLRRALRTYLKFRGKRLVSCSETHQPAAVRVGAGKAALKATVGNEQLRLSECSRWPEREACGQECLAQIQEAPKDSPTCQNYGSKQRLLPCSECVLMAFVPQDCQSERIPCRHISLNVEGYTIDTYYRLGTQEELEVEVAGWLRKTIQRLEGESAHQQGESGPPGHSYSAAIAGW